MSSFLSKFKSFLLLAFFAYALPALSDDMTVNLSGSFDFQGGYLKSNAPAKSVYDQNARPNYISANQKNMAFSTTASVGLEAKNIHESGLIYGARIGLATTAKSARKHQSSIFVEHDAGRFEFGSDKSAMSKMRISPYSVSAATGGMWDAWVKGDPSGTSYSQVPYITNFTNFLDSKMRLAGKVEYSRKITYYTPKFNGLQLGVSYVPDSSNVGYGEIKNGINHTPIFSDYYFSVKNGIAGGVTYEKQLNQIGLSLSAVGEMGKIIVTPKPHASGSPDTKIRNLRNYTLGAQVDYNDFALAASFGDYMRSFMAVSDKNANSEMHGVGASYKFGKLNTSITYMGSVHRKNNLNATTVGADYKIAKGFLPYAEVTYFNAKANKDNLTSTTKNHRGFLILAGARVEF